MIADVHPACSLTVCTLPGLEAGHSPMISHASIQRFFSWVNDCAHSAGMTI